VDAHPLVGLRHLYLLDFGIFGSQHFACHLAGSAMAICVAYALTDEGHQIFVAGRTASIFDVALDSTGAMFSGFLRAAISEII